MSRSSSGTTHLSGSTAATSVTQHSQNGEDDGLPPIISNAIELEAIRHAADLPEEDPLTQQFREIEHNLADLSLTMWASTYNHDDTVPGDADKPQLNGIRIQPVVQKRVYPDPDIRNMQSEDIKSLAFGYLINLYLDNQPLPIKLIDTKYSIKALCAVSPIIKSAVTANGPHSCLDNIALPSGSKSAYLKILIWVDEVIQRGRIVPLHDDKKTSLIMYYEIRAIAHALQIKPLWGNINNRYEKLVRYVPGKVWAVSVQDIREAFEREEYKDSILRRDIVENLAKVWVEEDVDKSKMRQIEDLTYELKDLWQELEEKLLKIGWKEVDEVARSPA